jgi:hypothetical protein
MLRRNDKIDEKGVCLESYPTTVGYGYKDRSARTDWWK